MSFFNDIFSSIENSRKEREAAEQDKIRYAYSYVNVYKSRKVRCCVCGKSFHACQTVRISLSSRKRFPVQYTTVEDALKYYNSSAITLDGVFRDAKAPFDKSAKNWIKKHSKPEIKQHALTTLHYPVVVPDLLNGWSHKDCHERKDLVAKAKEYAIKKIHFRKSNRFYCAACAATRITAAQKAMDEFLTIARKNHYQIGDLDTTALAHPEIERQKVNDAILNAGERGEKKVQYELSWLQPPYFLIENGNQKMYLASPKIMNGARQEFDHIVVGPFGVCVIETKNHTGKIAINKDGVWIQKKNRIEKAVPSPVSQVDRHIKVLRAIVPPEIPIYGLICIANDSCIVTGGENCSFPVVKSDTVRTRIENLRPVVPPLNEEKIRSVMQTIQAHRVI